MVLDLTNLNVNQYKIYYNFSLEIQNDFNLLISQIYKLNESDDFMKNITLMFSNTLSRNNYQSNMFTNILSLYFINHMLKQNNYDVIIVEDISLKKQLNLNYPDIRIILSSQTISKISYLKNNFLRPFIDFKNIFTRSINYIFSASKIRTVKLLRAKKIILIDTYIHNDTLKFQKYLERNYNHLLSNQTLVDEKSIFFVPTINCVFNKKTLNNIQKNSNENLIYKHDFLSLDIYIKIFKLMISSYIKACDLTFRGINVDCLIKDNIRNKKFDLSLFEALISFHFFKQLKKQNIDINGVIDWNENQPIDKGFVKGCKTFFSNIHIKGYQGFIVSYSYNMQLCPTALEIENNLIPDELVVTGFDLVNTVKRFSKNINVTVGPAFRFSKQYSKTNFIKLSDKILVILPFGIYHSLNLIKTLDEICETKNIAFKNFYLKPHPTDNFKILKSKLANADKYNFVFDKFNNIISEFSITIGNTSSALMESLLYSVPVIVIPNQKGITQNPIPFGVSSKLWNLCFSKQDVVDSILYFLKNRDLIKDDFNNFNKEVSKKYFYPVTEKNANIFLKF